MKMPKDLRISFIAYAAEIPGAWSNIHLAQEFQRLYELTEDAFAVIGAEKHARNGKADFLAVDDTARRPEE